MAKTLWVSPDNSNWKVHWEKGDIVSRHTTKENAVISARRTVSAQPKGEVLSIRVQKMDGTIQTEWTYGKDPYPPAG